MESNSQKQSNQLSSVPPVSPYIIKVNLLSLTVDHRWREALVSGSSDLECMAAVDESHGATGHGLGVHSRTYCVLPSLS